MLLAHSYPRIYKIKKSTYSLKYQIWVGWGNFLMNDLTVLDGGMMTRERGRQGEQEDLKSN